MKLPENLAIILAGVALGLALAQMIHPFGFRVHPGLMVVIAALLALRWVMRRQARRRAAMLQNVPKRPLGISDEE